MQFYNTLKYISFSRDKILKQVESGGNGDEEYDELKWPNSIVCTTYGDIVVCDTANHRLLVFTRDLIYKYKIGSKGNFHGQFDEPIDAAIVGINDLMIADKNNNRIEIYEEHLVFQRSKTKINAFIHSENNVQNNNPTADAQCAIINRLSRSNSIQYKYKLTIMLDDQPVKICTSTTTALFIITTLNGSFFIFNSSYRNLSSFKLNEHVDLFDMRNVCLHRNGNEFIMLRNVQNVPTLLFYEFQNNQINKLRSKSEDNKIKLVNSVELQRAYYAGICLERGQYLRLTPDSNYLVIYDSRNLCVLIYDINGKFNKIIFHSYDCLEQLLAMTFSPEGHFITCEYEVRNNVIKSSSRLQTSRALSSAYVRRYIFKIKIYRYLDCDCHRNRPSITKKRLSQTAASRRILAKSYF